MSEPEKNSRRLTELESSYMHLQSDYETLNEVVLENSKRLEDLSQLVQRLANQIEAAQAETQPRTPESEKPPHY